MGNFCTCPHNHMISVLNCFLPAKNKINYFTFCSRHPDGSYMLLAFAEIAKMGVKTQQIVPLYYVDISCVIRYY